MKAIGVSLVLLALRTSSWAQDVLTYHNDNARTGQNLNETILNTGNVNVNTFGKLFILPADGKVDAEPLYVSNLSMNTGTHNVVFVATEHDSVYAYDADNGELLWSVTMLGPGETPSDDRDCSELRPEIGVTATPVIDRSSGPHGTIYVVAMSKDPSGYYHQRLHALDITTGAEEFGGPLAIQATYPGRGSEGNGTTLTFDPKQHKARAALLLLDNIVYVAWSSHCDTDPYTAWIMGYDKGTLAQTRLLNITPNGYEGSVWQSGAGLAADSGGNIYFLTANGTADTTLNTQGFPSSGDYGNSFMKLSTGGGGLAVADYFNMFNTGSESDADQDLGSGGALVLPDMTDSNGVTWRLAVGAGKDQNMYLVNRDNMGQFNSATNRIYQQFPTPLRGPEFGMAAYFNNAIYYGAVGDNLRMFPFVNAKLTDVSSQTIITFAYPGTTPSVSANGTANGIVWATENNPLAVLHAYDATNLATELYNSSQSEDGHDHFGVGNKFITPMIANGKVYVGTTDGVGVFGLLTATLPQVAPSSLAFDSQMVHTASSAKSVTLTNMGTAALNIIRIATTGNFALSTGDNACGSTLAVGANCRIYVIFTPTIDGAQNGMLSINHDAVNSPLVIPLSGTGSTQSVLYLPQIVAGQAGGVAWTTSIEIMNPAPTGVASGTITFTQDNGAAFNVGFTDPKENLVGSGNTIPFQLAAGQTNFFSSTAVGPLTVGFATVTSNLPVAVGAVFVETSITTGRNIGQAGVAAATPLARQAVFATVTRTSDTGVAIANPNPTPAHITLQLVDTNGVMAFPAVNITLPPNNHTAEFVSPLFPAAGPSFFGTLEIISQTTLVTTALLFQSDGTFTTLPVISLGK
jgi:PQQ enzyme repeat